ncbi:MAG: hypothetical protein ACLUOF_08480 [Ruminococcus sp.]
MNTVLQTKGLCKTYIVNKRQNNVLKNIDLTIHEGEIVAIMDRPFGRHTLYCVSAWTGNSGNVFFDGRRSSNAVTRACSSLDEMGYLSADVMMKNHLYGNIIPPGEIQKNTKASRSEERDGHSCGLGIDDIGSNDINRYPAVLQRAYLRYDSDQDDFCRRPTGALRFDEVMNELLSST